MKDITIKTATMDSIIHCGAGTFETYAPRLADRQLFVVTDSNVFAYYRFEIWQTFGESVPVYVIPAGEKSKTMRYLTEILREMLAKGMKRNCTVIAFGGGVVGDLAGLAASLYMRGVHLVQIPTTFLSQVDSSVGGKTAIDFDGVKNAVGSFYQPEEVIADPKFLETLPDREIRCGLGEIVKYGALNAEIFKSLLTNKNNLKSPEFFDEITHLCIQHKAEVVAGDEHDLNGLRKTLNLGHTTGHALELYYRKKSHGEFVLIGMFYELYIAKLKHICGGIYAEQLEMLVRAVLGKIPAYDDIEKAAEFAKFDKKNDDSKISLIVPEIEGKCTEIKLSAVEYTAMLSECRDRLKEQK